MIRCIYIFDKIPFKNLRHSNTSKEEWEVVRALAGDLTIVIKKAGKGLYVAVLDRTVYLLETEKQLNNTDVYVSIEFKEKH